eukprot:11120410-Lingulodinium_polyedra.AAC.1
MTKYTRMAAKSEGVSEETTTGVHRLKEMASKGELLLPAIYEKGNEAIVQKKKANVADSLKLAGEVDAVSPHSQFSNLKKAIYEKDNEAVVQTKKANLADSLKRLEELPGFRQ